MHSGEADDTDAIRTGDGQGVSGVAPAFLFGAPGHPILDSRDRAKGSRREGVCKAGTRYIINIKKVDRILIANVHSKSSAFILPTEQE